MLYELTMRRREPEEGGTHEHRWIGDATSIIVVGWGGKITVFPADEWQPVEVSG